MTGVFGLPLTGNVNGRTWRLHAVTFETPDGHMSAYLYALSIEHARLLLSDLGGSGARVEQIEGQYDE